MDLDFSLLKQRYIRRRGGIGQLGAVLGELGLLARLRRPGGAAVAVVGGKTALSLVLPAVQADLTASLGAASGAEAIAKPVWYGGECSLENITSVTDSLHKTGAVLVVGVGGGKAIDTAKAAARRAGVPIVTVPTIAATCAAFTPLSVIYDAQGRYLHMEYDVEPPSAIIVDTDIIGAAPVRYLKSGIGDTVAKKFEIRAATERFFNHPSTSALRSVPWEATARAGLAAAARTFADQAFSLLTDAVTGSDPTGRLVDAIILFGGLASSFAGHGARTACAHAVHDALTLLPEARRFLHGELVAVGTLCQAVLEGRQEQELFELVDLFRRVGLPCSLSDVGLDAASEQVRRVAETAASSEEMANMPGPVVVTADDVFRALEKANALSSRSRSTPPALPPPPLALAQPAARNAKPYAPSIYDEEAPDIAKQLGLASVIKLSFNENTLGPSPKALAAMHEAVDRAAFYPDHTGRNLRTSLARRFGLTAESVVLANGADEVISLICQAFIQPGVDEAVISAPTFGTYRSSALLAGAAVREVPLTDFRHDVDALIQALTPETKLLFVCNPNNPTGRHATKAEVDALTRALPPRTILVLDEAYIDYVTAPDFPDALAYLRDESGSAAADPGSLGRRPNVITVRTFSKIHGLAGLRIGYALARPELAHFLQAVRLPVNINRVALAGALASLDDPEHLERVRSLVLAEKERLYREFSARGLAYQPSEANFVLVDVGADSEAICREALSHGIVLRPGTGFGMPTHVRYTIGSPSENDEALRTLDTAFGKVNAQKNLREMPDRGLHNYSR